MATGTGKTWVLRALMVAAAGTKRCGGSGVDDRALPGTSWWLRVDCLRAFAGCRVCGKAGGHGNGARNFATSDLAQYADLLVLSPPRGGVCLCARQRVCQTRHWAEGHWQRDDCHHQLAPVGWLKGQAWRWTRQDTIETPGGSAARASGGLCALAPGRTTGNSLDVLDRRYARGNVLEYLPNCLS